MTDGSTEYDCTNAGRELDAFVRGELPIESAERMQSHLDHCGHCAKVARYEQSFRERLRQLGAGHCPDELRQRINHLVERGGDE